MHSTFKMMGDLARFGALMLVLILGFALAFYAMFGSTSAALPGGRNIAEYDTYYSSLLTLFASMLGNFDFEVGVRGAGDEGRGGRAGVCSCRDTTDRWTWVRYGRYGLCRVACRCRVDFMSV